MDLKEDIHGCLKSKYVVANTQIHKYTNTALVPIDPTYVIFLKSRGFKDIKYANMSVDQTRPQTPDQNILAEPQN